MRSTGNSGASGGSGKSEKSDKSDNSQWKDHFSHASRDYRLWRPGYPRELFAWLASQTPATGLAWDCATGNGQAAGVLAEFFSRVVATDASAQQIHEAEPYDRVEYRVAPAEKPPLDDASADLVTVAQALHWFDVERFHAEARRVLKPSGVIAEWGYQLAEISAEIDERVRWFAGVTVGPYWPPERALIDAAYADIPFPFETVAAPPFAMKASWDLAHFVAYLGTWSSVSAYRRRVGSDPLPALYDELAPIWGSGERDVRWPLHLRVGQK
ncbi:MAG TPA: class I SAM-dependent methyltransferase [Candidatus Limnocylindrales bacterium]|nr:class I SAM-dependent methyltransferase [Candidatus Limnocylindrales bacterium]